MKYFALTFLLFQSFLMFSQDFVLNTPQLTSWYQVHEGDTVAYKFDVVNKGDRNFKFNISTPSNINVEFDSTGFFLWIPNFDIVSRIEESKIVSFIIEARTKNHKISKEIQFTVYHTNRPPTIGNLPIFYVRQYYDNTYNLEKNEQVIDPDGDPVIFEPFMEDLPQGARLSESGLFTWRPSSGQFRAVKTAPIAVRFKVMDLPSKTISQAELLIKATEMDLPPELQVVPGDSIITVMEDEVVNVNLYITDPNGEDDVADVGFVSNGLGIPKESLTKYTNSQWEFKWTPGYDLIEEAGSVDTLSITFYAIDNAGKKSDKNINIVVKDAENIVKKDERMYVKYRNILVAVKDLIDQLDANQKTLNKQLKKAKKGKKHRSIVNASLGAITGISPVFIENQDSKNYVSGIGGTAVLTLGTLEATEVIGRSKDALLERLKVNIDLRNQLQIDGDNFARKYALKTARRNTDFDADIDKLKAELNHKNLILLELPADWEGSNKISDEKLRKQFPDFNNEGFSQ